ncbi:MAG: hypothetical protein AAGJ46_08625 [Planctomycetota bacterium]
MVVSQADSTASVGWIEHQTLEHIKGALRVTVDARGPQLSQSRRAASICFVLQSFCRHLERLMRIEEEDGYMADVAEVNPCLSQRIRALALDHHDFRERVRELAPRVEAVEHWDEAEFAAVCEEIRDFLDRLDHHDEAEIRLLQEALTMDEGGEG